LKKKENTYYYLYGKKEEVARLISTREGGVKEKKIKGNRRLESSKGETPVFFTWKEKARKRGDAGGVYHREEEVDFALGANSICFENGNDA